MVPSSSSQAFFGVLILGIDAYPDPIDIASCIIFEEFSSQPGSVSNNGSYQTSFLRHGYRCVNVGAEQRFAANKVQFFHTRICKLKERVEKG
jgi:hypothetical protein